MVAEAVYSILAGKFSLLLHHIGHTQVVEAKVGRNARLIVAFEVRLSFYDVGPFGETLFPPFVVSGIG